jgi:hypothetical protein
MHSDKTDLKKVLSCLPDEIIAATQAYAQSNACSEEAVVEEAIARFFDSESATFAEASLELPESYQRALEDLRLQGSTDLTPYWTDKQDVLNGLPANITTLLEDCFVLLALLPLQTIELAIAQFLGIKPITFVASLDSPGEMREQEKALEDFLESTRRQLKRRPTAHRETHY